MRKRSQRIQPIRKLAAHHEKDAARELGQALRTLETHKQQLEQLLRYRQEYALQMTSRGSQGISAARLQEYQAFMETLDQNIANQEAHILEAEQVCRELRAVWQQRHGRTDSLGKAITRLEKHEATGERRREQREADELSGRIRREPTT
ncbi:MAG TPA: flagellar export protein FliJ [Gammaproteobacteria bacterium]|nr:flagellar export protein FliJ [Gammaproteobacteria bacterium]